MSAVEEFEWVQRELHSPSHSVDATIPVYGFRVIGNGPGLEPVGVDPLGRLWREGRDGLTCVYDPRAKSNG